MAAVCAVRNGRSRGVARYVEQLVHALAAEGLEYRPSSWPEPGLGCHFHLANSSRSALMHAPFRSRPFVVTVHDVVPRTAALAPLYRLLAYPGVVGQAAAVIVHSAFAADLLVREAGFDPARLEVIPHGAPRTENGDRLAARRTLGWPEDGLIAVLPGVLKRAKLVAEALAAAADLPAWRLALAGAVTDSGTARAAASSGALLLGSPDAARYEQAIVAADCVLCLRDGSVGETNGPLLDALGARRAVVATQTGSIPEVADNAARYCDGDAGSIRAALEALADPAEREELERAAGSRAEECSWERSAAAHAAIFAEVFGD
jgi:glycosyltransferase involved in cell wall biosynthesis